MISPSDLGMTPPNECTSGCSYKLQYAAPVLKCQDLSPSSITISSNTLLYSGTSSLWDITSDITSTSTSDSEGNSKSTGTGTSPSTGTGDGDGDGDTTGGDTTGDGDSTGGDTTGDGDNAVLAALPPVTPSTAPPANPTPILTGHPSNITYSVSLQWQPFDKTPTSNSDTTGRQGVECQFFDGNYEASMSFNGTSQLLTTEVTSVNQPLVGPMANQPNCPTETNSNAPCWVTATNYRATAEAFAELLVGELNWDDSGRITVYGSPGLISIFNISTIIGANNNLVWSFDFSMQNVSAALEEMFGNVTLALISARNDMTDTQVTFFGDNVWEYDAWLLWAIYAPTLFVFGLFAAHGLWCIKQDGAVDNTFLNFLVSTRSEDFDRAISNAADLDTVKGIAVTYAKNGAFEVVTDSISKMMA
jgi:hypothetical protein